MAGIGDATIYFNFPAQGGLSAMKGTLSLPYITSIDRTANVNLMEMPTLIYGASNNFCMDMGATEKITLSCERVNPFPYNDSSKNPDEWSNGKWYRYLESIFDHWQNFGLNSSGEKTGGVTFTFSPADTELHPVIKANVFLAGSLNMSYNRQKLSFSLPFQLGNMQMKDVQLNKVTLTLKTLSDSGRTLTSTLEAYQGIPTVVAPPSEWDDARKGMVFHGWLYNGSASSEIYAGSSYTFTEDATLVAKWMAALDVKVGTADGSYTVPSGASEVSIYAVGGGGGGGSIFILWGYGEMSTDRYTFIGGGGGSGETRIYTTNVSPGQTVNWTIGAGGTGGTQGEGTEYSTVRRPTNGGGGGDTKVYIDGNLAVTARGGSGGVAPIVANRASSCAHGTGGSQYCAGGTHGQAGGDSSRTLGCGFTADPNIGSNLGQPGTDIVSGSNTFPGGPSGGAAAFRYSFRTEDEAWHPGKDQYYQSISGDGIDWGDKTIDRYASNGQYGGGGGAGRTQNSLRAGEGGSGIVILVFFR